MMLLRITNIDRTMITKIDHHDEEVEGVVIALEGRGDGAPGRRQVVKDQH